MNRHPTLYCFTILPKCKSPHTPKMLLAQTRKRKNNTLHSYNASPSIHSLPTYTMCKFSFLQSSKQPLTLMFLHAVRTFPQVFLLHFFHFSCFFPFCYIQQNNFYVLVIIISYFTLYFNFSLLELYLICDKITLKVCK